MAAPAIDTSETLTTLSSGFLDVSHGHSLYFEVCCDPAAAVVASSAVPAEEVKWALFLHGGPGSGFREAAKTYFLGTGYRSVFLDQRGAGRSTPRFSVADNTTWHLVEDIEVLRKHLGVDKWSLVVGGSWGSTLSLAYAETHPSKVAAMVLWGIFTVRKQEIDWLYGNKERNGARFIHPEGFKDYLAALLSEEDRKDPLRSYYRLMTDPSVPDDRKIAAAVAFSRWEAVNSRLIPSEASVSSAEEPEFALARSRIEAHFFVNGGWFEGPENEQLIVNSRGKLKDVPTVLVQGRYDCVCPAVTAFDLHEAWPESRLVITPDAGHVSAEPSNRAVIVKAIQMFDRAAKKGTNEMEAFKKEAGGLSWL